MQALEDAKEFVGKLHVEADAIVANIDRGSLRHYAASDLYAGTFPSSRELHGVAEQIREHLLDERWITFQCRQRLDPPFDPSSLGAHAEFFNENVNHGTERNRLTVYVTPANP